MSLTVGCNKLERLYLAKLFHYVPMGLYHPLDGNTNLRYKLLCFLTPNKEKFKVKGTSF
jgi:hypothetical protein